jgi:hypothetical protein
MSSITDLGRTISRVPATTIRSSSPISVDIRASKHSLHQTFALPLESVDSGDLVTYPGWSWKKVLHQPRFAEGAIRKVLCKLFSRVGFSMSCPCSFSEAKSSEFKMELIGHEDARRLCLYQGG